MATEAPMSIREKINNDRKFGVLLGGVLIVAAVVFAVYEFRGMARGVSVLNTTYYSDDDGKTFFKDDIYKFPPFDHDGKTANAAVIFSTPQSGDFVGYLMRYTPAAKKQLDDAYQKAKQ